MNKLLQIQTELKAPKSQFNSFGKYNYRNCEDILESLKPLLLKYELTLTISDDMVAIGNRIYVRATASINEGGKDPVSVTAFARESEDKKGMDAAQVTGAASSYARKYALNGLFLIDDTKDVDNHDNREEKPTTAHSEPIKPIQTASISSETMRVIGKIDSSEDAGNGFVKYKVKGIELTSNKAPSLLLMDKAEKEGAEVQVEYSEVVKGKWTNRYITKVVTVESLPF